MQISPPSSSKSETLCPEPRSPSPLSLKTTPYMGYSPGSPLTFQDAKGNTKQKPIVLYTTSGGLFGALGAIYSYRQGMIGYSGTGGAWGLAVPTIRSHFWGVYGFCSFMWKDRERVANPLMIPIRELKIERNTRIEPSAGTLSLASLCITGLSGFPHFEKTQA